MNVPSLSTIQSYYLVIRWRRNRDAKYRRRTDIGKEQIDVKIICGKCKNDRNVKESNAIFNTTSRDARAPGTCLKWRCLKVIGLH